MKTMGLILGGLSLIVLSFLVYVRIITHLNFGTSLLGSRGNHHNIDSYKVITEGMKDLPLKMDRRVMLMTLDLATYHLDVLCEKQRSGQSIDSIKSIVEMDCLLLKSIALTKENVSLSELLNLNVAEVFDSPVSCTPSMLLYKHKIDSVQAAFKD